MANAVIEGRQGEQISVSDETVEASEQSEAAEPVDTTPRAPQKRESVTAEEIIKE